MASIISIRNRTDIADIKHWLTDNVDTNDILIDRISLTFISDEDAITFCIRFGIQPATYNPSLLNRLRE